jgi:diaminohydroxyphosphoribosylaminopyrimidine deaminase/5-amino-6-(5-phosphoribosylamino)uracil reductase
LRLAEEAIGVSEPNPRVGCIIGRADGSVLGRGATQRAGQAHAEVAALRAVQAAGASAEGATAWVTLEPCAHQGRTPPCTDALIAAGISRVVVGGIDPFPRVDGAGIHRLRAAGIDVQLADLDIAETARDLNIGFFTRMQHGRPWVRLKTAASLDGRTALDNGASQWITGEAARADGHAWRRRAGAVLTGIGTVLADDPHLDVRLVPTQVQPLRIVLDSALRTPADARLLAPPGKVLIVTTPGQTSRDDLLALGVEVLELPIEDGRVALAPLLVALGGRGINELHVEAGQRLNAAFLQARLVDELLVYLAPMLLGRGRGIAESEPLQRLASAPRFTFAQITTIGDDLRLRARTTAATESSD